MPFCLLTSIEKSHCTLTMSSSADQNRPHTFNPATAPVPPPTYHQVAVTPLVASSKLITLAGQVGWDPRTGDQPSDFTQQVRLAYINVRNCLAAAGAVPRDIIHVRHYIVQNTGDAELDRKEILDRGWGPLWIEFMDKEADGHRPPDTVLAVAGLAKRTLLYEVEVWAVVGS